MEEIIRAIMEHGPEVVEAILAIIGGMKVLARYTKWKWDDKLFDQAENVAKKAKEVLPKRKK